MKLFAIVFMCLSMVIRHLSTLTDMGNKHFAMNAIHAVIELLLFVWLICTYCT